MITVRELMRGSSEKLSTLLYAAKSKNRLKLDKKCT